MKETELDVAHRYRTPLGRLCRLQPRIQPRRDRWYTFLYCDGAAQGAEHGFTLSPGNLKLLHKVSA